MTSVLASTRAELADLLAPHRARGDRIGLVCTMGAMHEGHASLMRRTRAEIGPDAPLVVSLFVNPLQFGPNEDLARYPRTFDEDLALCAAEGVDVVFAPSVDEVYPGGTPQVTVDPGPLADVLEGATRPGHSSGAHGRREALRPGASGRHGVRREDSQQLALVRRMSGDLCLGVEVLGSETMPNPTAWRCPAATGASIPSSANRPSPWAGRSAAAQAAGSERLHRLPGRRREDLGRRDRGTTSTTSS